jgi:peptidoglycan/LPS O-acetylase OafA/YrhL
MRPSSPRTAAANSRSERSPELDLLRFIAASAVLLYHYTYRPAIHGVPSISAYGSLQHVSRYGYLGVPLFFLISGFVITWSAHGRTVGQFALARFKRLYPMFWLGLGITLTVLTISGRRAELLRPGVIAANLTMLPGRFDAPAVDGVYWTLAIELKLYVYIAILIAVKQLRHLELWLYLWLVGLLLALCFPAIHVLSSLSVAPYGSYFVAGAICYLIHASGITPMRVIALIACLGASAWWGLGDIREFTTAPALAAPGAVVVLIALCYAAVIAVAVRAWRLPHAGVWFALGSLTYPLYLLHNVVGKETAAALEPLLGDWLRLLVVACLVYALAWVCARWAEPWVRGLCGRALNRIQVVAERAVRLIADWRGGRQQRDSEDSPGDQ